MPHPLVMQLRFTRSEWIRGLKAVTAEEAARRFGPINPIAWMIGHLAWQEQLYWQDRSTLCRPSLGSDRWRQDPGYGEGACRRAGRRRHPLAAARREVARPGWFVQQDHEHRAR